jgi:hypothetical protein
MHGYSDTLDAIKEHARAAKELKLANDQLYDLKYRFHAHYFSFADKLIKSLNESSIEGMLDVVTEEKEYFDKYVPSDLVDKDNVPVSKIDFKRSGAYALYGWELFVHTPLMLAIHLSKNGRYEEAQQMFHLVFDPTDDSDGPTPERFWKVPEFKTTDVASIERILVNLATGEDHQLLEDTLHCINQWKDKPYRPHVVARYRPTAYMYKTVMAYLDNLIVWGDALFRENTRESITDATQIYVLAANILGPRPQAVPKRDTVRPRTYANLKENLDALGNARIAAEADIPGDGLPHPGEAGDLKRLSVLHSIGTSPYFCIPRNEKLLGYWDTVADRLFKIRNSLNIQGIFRQLPLFEPPIDPALLAKATAAGLDVAAVVSGRHQPLPKLRFQFLVQKAAEICQELKSLGSNLLSVLEKEDNEALAVLRARHEIRVMNLAETIKYSQWQESIKNLEGLVKSFDNAKQAYTYYRRLLGEAESQIKVNELDELERDNLENMRFQQEEPTQDTQHIEIDIVQGNERLSRGKKISSHEYEELENLHIAQAKRDIASGLRDLAAILRVLPDFGINLMPVGIGGETIFGGEALAKILTIGADIKDQEAGRRVHLANKAAKIGIYGRREQEWAYQSNRAALEINQIYKQLRAAQIRTAIAKRELANHKQQIKHSREMEQFLSGEKMTIGNSTHSKTGTQSFYSWMKAEIKGLYSRCYDLAFEIAQKAERALKHELGDPGLNFLKYNYTAGKEGLLAGEKLYLDIKHMEMKYHELNEREYELTKHVSLRQVNPIALLGLRATGSCSFNLPEELFDLDCPGHYFRRIKQVAVSIPCVAGPYTSLNSTLTLLKSSIREVPLLSGSEYKRIDADDERFKDDFSSMQSIVTSTGQNDTGMFDGSVQDERTLPFTNSGVISQWRIQLPANPSAEPPEPLQFDYDTISDVIIHVRYTAREGGEILRRGAIDNLNKRIDDAEAVGSIRLFSVRHEFPNAWAAFKNIVIDVDMPVAKLTLNLRSEHYPYCSQQKIGTANVKKVELFARLQHGFSVFDTVDANGRPIGDECEIDAELGNLLWGALTISPDRPIDENYTLYFSNNSMDELWLAITWGNAK